MTDLRKQEVEHPTGTGADGAALFSVQAQGEPGLRLISVSVSAPCEAGEPAGWRVILPGSRTLAPQARVLSRRPDGRPRTLLVRFPWEAATLEAATFRLEPGDAPPAGQDLLTQKTPYFFSMVASRRRLTLLGNHLSVLTDGAAECGIEILGPDFPVRFMGPEISVFENGPYFAWLAVDYFGGTWNARLEVKADCLGEVEMVTRLLRVRSDAAFPRFGFRVFSSNATAETGGQPDFVGRKNISELPDRAVRLVSPSKTTTLWVPDGPQVSQGRVVVSRMGGEIEVQVCRAAELEDREPIRFLEGQERSVGLVLLSPDSSSGGSQRVVGIADPACRPAAPSPCSAADWGELDSLRRKATDLILNQQCLKGDRYGDMSPADVLPVIRNRPKNLPAAEAGFLAFEDYYRGGDARLREWSLRLAEHYASLQLYRGQDLSAYGGARGAGEHEKEIPSCCQTGASFLLMAYEETGDPRYREAAMDCLDRAVKQLERTSFLRSYSLTEGWLRPANIRAGRICADLVALYRYAGDPRYLDTAVRVLRGLSRLRVGEELWKEVYGDPFSPFEIAITGEDVGVLHDTANSESPFALHQVLLGAQAVFQETEDEQVRKIVVDISDWLVESQTEAGLWNFPQTGSPAGSISRLALLISRALLKSYVLTGEPAYFQAAEDALRLIVQLFQKYAAFPEAQAPDKPYFYTEDFTDVDFRRLKLVLGRADLDTAAAFLAAMNEYLQVAFDAPQSLRLPIANVLGQFLLGDAPATDLSAQTALAEAGRPSSPEEEDYRKCLAAEAVDSPAKAIEHWEQYAATYEDTPLEYLRILKLAERAADTAEAEGVIARFLEKFPGHPRSGWLRLRLAAISEAKGDFDQARHVLRNIVEGLYGSVWGRDAAAHLFRLGVLPRPEATVLAVSASGEHPVDKLAGPFIDPSTGNPSAQRTHFFVTYDEHGLKFHASCHDRAFSGDEIVRVFLDPVHDYETWCTFEASTNGERTFRDLGWAGNARKHPNEADWSARVRAEGISWDVIMSVPWDKLDLSEPVQGRIIGLNVERESYLGRSLWLPMLSEPVMPQAFGRLLFS